MKLNIIKIDELQYLLLSVGIIGNPHSSKDLDVMVVVSPIAPQLSVVLPITTLQGLSEEATEELLSTLYEYVPSLKECVEDTALPTDLHVVSSSTFEHGAAEYDDKTWSLIKSSSILFEHGDFKRAKNIILDQYFCANKYFTKTKGHITSLISRGNLPKAYRLVTLLRDNLGLNKELNGKNVNLAVSKSEYIYSMSLETDATSKAYSIDSQEITDIVDELNKEYKHISGKFTNIPVEVRNGVMRLLHPLTSHKIELPLSSSRHCDYAIYDVATQTLTYKFTGNDEEFYYYNVPITTIESGLGATSWGSWFNTNIRHNPLYTQ